MRELTEDRIDMVEKVIDAVIYVLSLTAFALVTALVIGEMLNAPTKVDPQ